MRSPWMEVSLVFFDKTAFALSRELHGQVKVFIDGNYVDERETNYERSRSFFEETDTEIAGILKVR